MTINLNVTVALERSFPYLVIIAYCRNGGYLKRWGGDNPIISTEFVYISRFRSLLSSVFL